MITYKSMQLNLWDGKAEKDLLKLNPQLIMLQQTQRLDSTKVVPDNLLTTVTTNPQLQMPGAMDPNSHIPTLVLANGGKSK